MFCADLVVSSEKTNNYPMQQRIRHHLFQVGHAHDIELGWEREGQWEPVAVAALAVGGQGVAQGASANAQAAVGDQDNLQGPGRGQTLPAAGAPEHTHTAGAFLQHLLLRKSPTPAGISSTGQRTARKISRKKNPTQEK